MLPYLAYEGDAHYDVALQVDIIPESGEGKTVCNQLQAHVLEHASSSPTSVNGRNIRGGDVMASGTIGGPGSFGSMLGNRWRGTQPVGDADGTERKFILNGTLCADRFAGGSKPRMGLGGGWEGMG